jgi:DNA-binding MarR family transcriptional regulator
MSTSFTKRYSPQSGSQPLGQLLVNAQQWVNLSVLHQMTKRGHRKLSAAHLSFLANLDCGLTHASAVARRMGVSRQAVYRTTAELQALKILELVDDPGKRNQKIIRITRHGETVIRDARSCLAQVEATLRKRLGAPDFEQLVVILRADWGPLMD